MSPNDPSGSNAPGESAVVAPDLPAAIAEEQEVAPLDPLEVPVDATLVEYAAAWFRRVRSGESGVLPVIAGLAVIIVIFQTQSSVFLSAGNLTNLLEQGAVFVLLGMAEVFVLLLGEIDLSTGFTAGVGAVVTAALAAPPKSYPWPVAVLAGLAAAGAIGFIQGQLITRLRLPSFVVTLAGLLGLEGGVIYLIGLQDSNNGGTIRVTNQTIINFVNGSLSPTTGWVVMGLGVAVYAVLAIMRDRRWRASGLVAPPMALTALKIIVMAAAGILLVAVCNTNRGRFAPVRGVPWVVPIIIGVLIAWTVLLERTRFGRYVYAIGGSVEAARRAGVNVRRIRLIAFMLCSLTAGAAGIIYESRLGSISSNIDGGTLVLYAVASAVIGGTSLFGGRGKMIHAVLGGIVIATIYNGMGLIGLTADKQYMVTALVLLCAVAIDAIARRARTA
jgi:D-xylose transport system permease protein